MCRGDRRPASIGLAKVLALGFAVLWSAIPARGDSHPPAILQLAQEQKAAQALGTIQEFQMTMSVYPGEFRPDPLTVKKGIPVRLFLRALEREHLNQVSIRPFVTNVTLEPPGKVTIIEFVPERVGTFKIRNLGHDFEGSLIVVE